MAKIDVNNSKARRSASIELADAVFAAEVNEHLLYEVVKAPARQTRAGTAATKDRDAVRGGGKKPWKQKGTGRARQGSIPRAPLGRRRQGASPPSRATTSTTCPRRCGGRAALGAVALRQGGSKLMVLDSFELDADQDQAGRRGADKLGAAKALIVDARERDAAKSARNLAKATVPAAGGPQRLRRARPRPRWSSPAPPSRPLTARLKQDRRKEPRHEPARAPDHPAPAPHREGHPPHGDRRRPAEHFTRGDLNPGALRGGRRRQQDRDQAARSRRSSASRSSTSTPGHARQGEAHRPLRAAAPELEEGDRHPAGQARPDRVLRASEASEQDGESKIYKPTSAGRRGMTVIDFTEITKKQEAREALIERTSSTGGRNNHGRITTPLPRRRPQAALPHHRLQARQDRRARQGRGDRVRSQPHRAHRAAPLRRRREALHPRPRQAEGGRRR